jgi:hypothetical protein
MADVHPTSSPRRPDPYPADKARQGEIILKSSWQRAIFIAGLVSVVVLALGFSFLR